VKELIAVAVGGTIVMNILIAGYVVICAWFISVLSKLSKLVFMLAGKQL
jgi:hypothetical protein